MNSRTKKALTAAVFAAVLIGAIGIFFSDYTIVQGKYATYSFVKTDAEKLPAPFYKYSKDYPAYIKLTNGVKRLKNLKKLSLDVSPGDDLGFLSEFDQLEYLSLYCSTGMRAEPGEENAYFDIASLPRIGSLKELELSYCTDTTGGSLGKYENLKYLSISDSPAITDFSFVKHTHALREIELQDYTIYKENILPVKDLSALGELPCLEKLYLHITNDSYSLDGIESSQSLKTVDIALYGGDMNKGGYREKAEALINVHALESVELHVGDYEELTNETKLFLNEWLKRMRQKGVKAYASNMCDVVNRVWDNDMIMEKKAPDLVRQIVSQRASNDYEKLIADSGITADEIKALTPSEERKMTEAEKLTRTPLQLVKWYKAENAEITDIKFEREADGKIFLSFTGNIRLNFSDDRKEEDKQKPEYLFVITAKTEGVIALPDGTNYNVYENDLIGYGEITSINYSDIKVSVY